MTTRPRDLDPAEKKLVENYSAMKTSLKNTVERLRELADDLDEVWRDCQQVSAVATGVGILGGVLTIAGGVIATIMTAGTAVPFLVAGTALGATAACTNIGTSTVEAKTRSDITKEAEQAVEEANRKIQQVKNQINELRMLKSNSRLLFCTWVVTLMVGKNPMVAPFLKQLLPARLFSSVTSRAFNDFGKEATKSTGAFIIGVSVVFLIVDIIDLNYKVRDIVKNKGSDAARDLRRKANQYETILKGLG